MTEKTHEFPLAFCQIHNSSQTERNTTIISLGRELARIGDELMISHEPVELCNLPWFELQSENFGEAVRFCLLGVFKFVIFMISK